MYCFGITFNASYTTSDLLTARVIDELKKNVVDTRLHLIISASKNII